jgi:uncharacterized protein
MGGKQRLVTCPQCGKSVAWSAANRFRPFCSERCKMIDLGAWATESYRIPVADDEDAPDENEERSSP